MDAELLQATNILGAMDAPLGALVPGLHQDDGDRHLELAKHTAVSTFHCFGRLPKEIRIVIYVQVR